MAIRQPKYSKEEFAQHGDEIYESQIRSPEKVSIEVIMVELL
jgi:hypothetical protein